MAKKFGKFLLFTAAVGTAAAAAYYYMQQKDSQLKESSDADDDYDDFHEDLDKSTEQLCSSEYTRADLCPEGRDRHRVHTGFRRGGTRFRRGI